MEYLFNDIGKKIMSLAKILCWIGIACSVIGWMSGLIASADSPAPGIIILLSFVILAVGALSSWIGSLAMYAFGQIVDDNQNMRAQMSLLINKTEAISAQLNGNSQGQGAPVQSFTQPTQPAEPVQHTYTPVYEPNAQSIQDSYTEEQEIPEPDIPAPPRSTTRLVRAGGASKQGYCLACGRLNVSLLRCTLEVDGVIRESYRCGACIARLKGNE